MKKNHNPVCDFCHLMIFSKKKIKKDGMTLHMTCYKKLYYSITPIKHDYDDNVAVYYEEVSKSANPNT